MKFPLISIKKSSLRQFYGYCCFPIYGLVKYEYNIWCCFNNRPFKEHLNIDNEYYLKVRKHIMELEL